MRSRTGNGRNEPALSWVRRSSKKPLDPDLLFDVGDRQAIDPRSAGSGVARNPVERHDQRRRVVHEIEQVIEPAARIGRRQAVKLGPASPIPATTTLPESSGLPLESLRLTAQTVNWTDTSLPQRGDLGIPARGEIG